MGEKEEILHGRTFGCHLRVLGQDSYKNYNVEIDILRSGPVQNGTWEFRNLETYAHTFVGCPILCAYVLGQVGDSHNMEKRRDSKGEAYFSFMGNTAERIVGSISENPDDVFVQEKNGYQWVTARGKLWRFYAKELVDKIAEQGRMDVSAETNTYQETTETEGEREIYNTWTGIGVTILGDRVDPAVPNAHIRALAAMEQEFETAKLRAAALEKPQTKVKEGVKRPMNKKLLEKLGKLFEGYRVLSCCETGRHVLLLAEDGTVCTYQFSEDDPMEHVYADRVKPVCLSATHQFEDGTALTVDTGDMFTTLSAQLSAAQAGLTQANSELNTAKSTITAMQNQENSRRALAAEEAVKSRLLAVNANRGESEKIDSKVADTIVADCKAGRFNACVDASGNWTGDKEAVTRLMAAVGEAQTKLDELRKSSQKAGFIWEQKNLGGQQEPDGIDALLSSINN
ncbi:hypothetical protein [uncultured Dysosmobacter sp.]|uniref:hypothetical protein n=1 Tax=uncultured Dysosmobacter sp. TaxID=2591384 RepID=UPI002635DE3E|nr:hypothetical protein [uncultured Dysosmobacter sp.]